MTSLQTHIAQPLTRKFVNTDDYTGEGYGFGIFLQSDIDTWVAANSSKINRIGSLYIIPGTTSGNTFEDVLEGNGGATQLNRSVYFNQRKTMTDMGKQIVIGNANDSELLVLRLIRTPANSQSGQEYIVGYVPIENNSTELGSGAGRFMVRVARV